MRLPKPMQRRSAVFALAILVIGAAALIYWRMASVDSLQRQLNAAKLDPEVVRKFNELEARERELANKLWPSELSAQRHGLTVDAFWNELNRSPEKLKTAANLELESITVPKYDGERRLAHDISLREPALTTEIWSREQWREALRLAADQGWKLSQSEFRHVHFEEAKDGRGALSRYYFSAHLTNGVEGRGILEGALAVQWESASANATDHRIQHVDASAVQWRSRWGSDGFKLLTSAEILPPVGSFFIDPIIVTDLEGDGIAEILLTASNLLLRRNGERFESRQLCKFPPGLIFTAVAEDFTGDGVQDLLCAKFEGLFLYKGTGTEAFEGEPVHVWKAPARLRYGQVLTCGDVDDDGDLDVWLGQYKVPYERGQMPQPYWDAQDGHPAYLLQNEGGVFSDVTYKAGLAAKRHRRSYSGSFADLDDDGDLDLVVVSDFSGLDLYANDGRGEFTDKTAEWVSDRQALGMAHLLADFNGDGRQDLLMIGMNSPTVDRLTNFKLTRSGDAGEREARSRLTYGNRLLLAGGGKTLFQQSKLSDSIVRSGWSWGATAFDINNDAHPDVYVANGHETNEFVQDYEPEFWLHDVYVGNSNEDLIAHAYFSGKIARTRGRGHSYGGYERNRLYWNDAGRSFVEVAHLLGVALPEDCRNVVSEDLDGDGRMDLIVSTFEAWPRRKQTIRIFQNTLDPIGNWVGVRLPEGTPGVIRTGAKITLRKSDGTSTMKQIVTGDSYRSQHRPAAHFGLGAAERVEAVEIRWPGSRIQPIILRNPAINEWHIARPIRSTTQQP